MQNNGTTYNKLCKVRIPFFVAIKNLQFTFVLNIQVIPSQLTLLHFFLLFSLLPKVSTPPITLPQQFFFFGFDTVISGFTKDDSQEYESKILFSVLPEILGLLCCNIILLNYLSPCTFCSKENQTIQTYV